VVNAERRRDIGAAITLLQEMLDEPDDDIAIILVADKSKDDEPKGRSVTQFLSTIDEGISYKRVLRLLASAISAGAVASNCEIQDFLFDVVAHIQVKRNIRGIDGNVN
jgi:hypothetical protein